ncbi:putative flp protein [Blattamonas nauphoetae]|uniref:Flp protein n=1 Tax=Blattamonas nauphoetae TaxID=2049346 RepID=A0ABQ9Y9V6_9EUKA|nr:putative flp protein [Blattamonas nauphoetae]
MPRTFETLATHKFTATFQGINHRPCMFLTSNCPDRCGHPQDFAVFNVDKYEEYTKPGEYGDEQQTAYHMCVNENINEDKQDPAIIAKVKSLQPGQKVRVHYDHIYVDSDGSKWPERPCRSIDLL